MSDDFDDLDDDVLLAALEAVEAGRSGTDNRTGLEPAAPEDNNFIGDHRGGKRKTSQYDSEYDEYADVGEGNKRAAFVDNGADAGRMCKCGIQALERTSNTSANPGRVFYKCCKPDAESCKFFEWGDQAPGAGGSNGVSQPFPQSSGHNAAEGGAGGGGGGGGAAGSSGACFNCGDPGHWSRDCPTKGGGASSFGGPKGLSGTYTSSYGSTTQPTNQPPAASSGSGDCFKDCPGGTK
eukprot:gene12680-15911_t